MKIGPYHFQITSDPKKMVHNKFRRKDLGFFDKDAQTIYISSKQGDDCARVTMMHELLHASIHVSEARGCFRNSRQEEDIVTLLAPVLLDALQSNPYNTDYMLRRNRVFK